MGSAGREPISLGKKGGPGHCHWPPPRPHGSQPLSLTSHRTFPVPGTVLSILQISIEAKEHEVPLWLAGLEHPTPALGPLRSTPQSTPAPLPQTKAGCCGEPPVSRTQQAARTRPTSKPPWERAQPSPMHLELSGSPLPRPQLSVTGVRKLFL